MKSVLALMLTAGLAFPLAFPAAAQTEGAGPRAPRGATAASPDPARPAAGDQDALTRMEAMNRRLDGRNLRATASICAGCLETTPRARKARREASAAEPEAPVLDPAQAPAVD